MGYATNSEIVWFGNVQKSGETKLLKLSRKLLINHGIWRHHTCRQTHMKILRIKITYFVRNYLFYRASSKIRMAGHFVSPQVFHCEGHTQTIICTLSLVINESGSQPSSDLKDGCICGTTEDWINHWAPPNVRIVPSKKKNSLTPFQPQENPKRKVQKAHWLSNPFHKKKTWRSPFSQPFRARGPLGVPGREVFGHVPDSEVCNLTIREVTKAHRGERWLGWPVSFWRSQWHWTINP